MPKRYVPPPVGVLDVSPNRRTPLVLKRATSVVLCPKRIAYDPPAQRNRVSSPKRPDAFAARSPEVVYAVPRVMICKPLVPFEELKPA